MCWSWVAALRAPPGQEWFRQASASLLEANSLAAYGMGSGALAVVVRYSLLCPCLRDAGGLLQAAASNGINSDLSSMLCRQVGAVICCRTDNVRFLGLQ